MGINGINMDEQDRQDFLCLYRTVLAVNKFFPADTKILSILSIHVN